MTLRPGEHVDELISASLTGDLSELEQASLTRHLADCARCRDTLAAFSEERRLISGMRHLAPPRDLGARVRTGIENRGFEGRWWRRPGLLVGMGASVATIAAAVLAVIVLGDLRAPVAQDGSPPATASIGESAAASASALATVEPSAAPSPTAPPQVAKAEPAYTLAFTGPADNQALTVRNGVDGSTISELATPAGPPINSELSPDGRWIAYVTEVGLKGTNMIHAADLETGEALELGESLAGSPFVEALFWSGDGRFLLYTLADPEGDTGTDAWLFDTSDESVERVTELGSGYAAGWRNDSSGSHAWISVAGPDPISYQLAAEADGHPALPFEPGAEAAVAEHVFQPLWNGTATGVIFWQGSMQFTTDAGPKEYLFAQGGAPYITSSDADAMPAWEDAEPLFSDVTIGADAFTSAAIAWGPDGDGYAVWKAEWAGTPQSSDGSAYPDPRRVYFSHLSDDRNIRQGHALDADDLPADGSVVDVVLAPTESPHLAITIRFPVGGDMAVPTAELRLVRRNTGTTPDEVIATGARAGGWIGPAMYEP
jgi:anti-sigma factor RsiW